MMVEVIVEHDYIAKEPNELSLTKGDIIKDAVRKQLGWWEGTLKDKKGLFPDSNVKVIDKDPSVVLRNRKDVSRIRQCRVIFSYKQDHEDELNLSVGDIIDILGEEEEGWWRGILNGRQGVFPSNFVEEIVNTKINTSRENLTNVLATQEAAPSLHAKPSKILCEVKYPYKAQNTDELTLKEGDIVVLLSKDGQDPGWWKGELNGFIGVFPDNFVTVLPTTNDETPIKDEKRPKTYVDTPALKPTTISSQRKSLELQNNEKTETDLTSSKTTPPLPGKKPTIPVKKSPSSSGSTGGIFYGLKKKIVDVVDGATASKNISPPKTEPTTEHTTDNVFDDVQRRPLLSDVRASRPKAPGRRPPSVIGKDAEPGIMNGSTDHNLMETLMETNYSSSIESDVVDNKPKLKEWEKHKAPWLEEMKQNQAKRGSNVPTGTDNKLKLTPTDRVNSEVEEIKPTKPFEKQPSPVIDKSKSVSGLSNRMKTPTNEFPVIRNKPNVPIPSRPQTIQNITNLSDVYLQKQSITPTQPKVSPVCNKTPSPSQKVTVIDPNVESNTGGGDSLDEVPSKYLELEQRIAKLEELLEKQQLSHQSAIEELRGKLQIETEMRMKLQVKFERFIGEGAIQQL